MSSKAAKRYNRGLWFLEKIAFRELRRRLLREVSGKILEIGIGTGANTPFYPETELIAGIDSRPEMIAGISSRKSSNLLVAACADASSLPFPTSGFDYVVSSLVFCSVVDVDTTLNEIRRVLKPGGKLLMMEHVRGKTTLTRLFTDWLHPIWFALQKECHLNRETEISLRKAGFTIDQSSIHGYGIIQVIKAFPGPN